MNIRRDVPLAPFTTFELGGPARAFVEVGSVAELRSALEYARDQRMPTLVIGGGSNLVVADAGFDGLAIKLASRGIQIEGARVTVAAGEPWDPFVAEMVARDLAGVEALSGIPGSVGATPIQNVGAYGQEVAETIVSVRTLDPRTLETRERSNAECGFSYRHSAFKSGVDEIVTEVVFELRPGGAPSIKYPELEKALSDRSLAHVRDTVIRLRRGKSMVIDPADPNRRSAGSFFVNPIVPAAVADAIGIADMPRFPAPNGMVKLSAGWLIERSGMAKGTRRGNVGISTRHALALVHHGGGSAAELMALAREVQDAVRARFGVELSPEPVRVGF
jgi:UDP-N-acetylmuramate dehydrogenase